jgi:hypothetical protein
MNILKSFQPSNKSQKFYTFEGDCYKIEDKPFGNLPVRRDVARHYRQIDSINKLKSCLRAGEYTSVGMYRLFFTTNDGACLSFSSVLDNLQSIYYSMMNDINDGWQIIGLSSVEECDDEVFCDHSNELLS